jgi:hypothetical protein
MSHRLKFLEAFFQLAAFQELAICLAPTERGQSHLKLEFIQKSGQVLPLH